jgi:hypothetical protein
LTLPPVFTISEKNQKATKMLIIRHGQMDNLRKEMMRTFVEEMVLHLHQFAPRHCQVIGDEMVRKTIQVGLENADAYGFNDRGPLRYYLEMMFMFGSAFDTDPQMPWAAESLKGEPHMDQFDRSMRLYENTTAYLERVAGPENIYTVRALRRLADLAGQELPPRATDFQEVMLSHLEAAYPEKCAYVGEDALMTLIDEGVEGAKEMSFSSVRGMALFVVLMFALGHGFADDPLFPWISKSLTDPRITDPGERAMRLEAKALTYLSHVLKYLEAM